MIGDAFANVVSQDDAEINQHWDSSTSVLTTATALQHAAMDQVTDANFAAVEKLLRLSEEPALQGNLVLTLIETTVGKYSDAAAVATYFREQRWNVENKRQRLVILEEDLGRYLRGGFAGLLVETDILDADQRSRLLSAAGLSSWTEDKVIWQLLYRLGHLQRKLTPSEKQSLRARLGTERGKIVDSLEIFFRDHVKFD